MTTMAKRPENPFAALAGLRDQLPAGPSRAPAAEAKVVPKGPARAVIRLERKGHGGKEATVVEQLELAGPALETLCVELKRALGCGGQVDGTRIVLQGDLRKRLEALLLERGVRKVIRG